MTARLFELYRHVDVTGLSGTGVIADGAQWSDGTVSLRWLGPWGSFSNWPDLDTMLAVHGHQGATEVRWLDEPPTDRPRPACAYPHADHGDGRGCGQGDCPRHGQVDEDPLAIFDREDR